MSFHAFAPHRRASGLITAMAVYAVTVAGHAFAQTGAVDHAAHHTPQPALTFTTSPTPPVVGRNSVRVAVASAEGTPVIGAEVSVEFVMAAMPAMGMGEIRQTVALKADDDPKASARGEYAGAVNLAMGGKWTVTVTVKVDEKEFARKTVALTAR